VLHVNGRFCSCGDVTFCVEVSNQAQCRHAYIANRCITVHINSAMSWYDARRSCLDAGGDILRVDDVDILDRLTGWFSEHSRWWIDGVNEIWNWDDGTLQQQVIAIFGSVCLPVCKTYVSDVAVDCETNFDEIWTEHCNRTSVVHDQQEACLAER